VNRTWFIPNFPAVVEDIVKKTGGNFRLLMTFVDVGTQTELNKNKDVGVSCSFRSVCNGSAAEPVFSSQSTQGFSSQGSDITYHPHDSEEMEYEQEWLVK